MKTTKIVLIVILCGIISLLCGFLGYALTHRGQSAFLSISGSTVSSTYELVLEQVLPAEEITDIQILYDMNSNDVYFYESDDDNITVREYLNFTPGEDDLSTITQNGSKLTVQGKRRDTLFIGNTRSGYTEVYLPDATYEALQVVTVSGDIFSKKASIVSYDMSVSTTSGDINFPRVEASDLQLGTTSGDIFLDEVYGANIQVSSTSGDIRFASVMAGSERTSEDTALPDGTEGKLVASTTSGDIKLLGGSGDYDISSNSGDITLGEMNGSFHLETTSGNISAIDGIGGGEVNTVSGNIRISLSELTENLNAGTTSGEVDLKLPENASFAFDYSSTSGDCSTFFDDALNFNKKGNQASGNYGDNGDIKVTVSSVSGNLRVTAY